jgi:hypothetical protein
VHLFTERCGVNNQLHVMRKTDCSECPLCGHEEETVAYFLGQCPAIAQPRHYFHDYYLSVNDIFDRVHIVTIVSFHNYIIRRGTD